MSRGTWRQGGLSDRPALLHDNRRSARERTIRPMSVAHPTGRVPAIWMRRMWRRA